MVSGMEEMIIKFNRHPLFDESNSIPGSDTPNKVIYNMFLYIYI